MNKSSYVEKIWHACDPLSIAENSQEFQHDCIYRRDRPEVQSELLIAMPMIAVCAPSLLESGAGLKRPRDLLNHSLLYDQAGIDRWAEWLQEVGLEPAQAAEGPVIIDPNVRMQSAIDGHGLVLGNPLMQPEIDDGRLIEPFDIRLQGYGYYLVYNRQLEQNRAFSLFRQWLRNQIDAYADESVNNI